MISILLLGITYITILKADTLSGSISGDRSLGQSSHTVDDNVVVDENSTLTIPNGATITFTGSYTIRVYGDIKIGCDFDTSVQGCDVSGVCYGSIVNINTNSNSIDGEIYLQNNGKATICDANFTGIRFYAHDSSTFNIDNSEFSNLGYNTGIYQSTYNNYDTNNITDCTFHEMAYGIEISDGHAMIDNCKFTKMHYSGVQVYAKANVSQCIFIGDEQYSANGIYFSGWGGTISDCTFNNLTEGIQANSNVKIEYNIFNYNNNGVDISTSSQIYVNYNNFISNNHYAIYLSGNYQQYNLDKNYYDVSNPNSETDVASKIGDICGGAQGFATYWPWYTSTIDFAQVKSGIFPTEANLVTSNTPICTGADNHPEITGSKLNPLYSQPATLTTANSPYYVVSHVLITSTLSVDNGVEIIFADDYAITVQDGTLDMCDGSVGSDTFDTPGTVSNNATTVSGDYSNANNTDAGPFGSILINNMGQATFCNVVFNKVNQAINVGSDNPIMIDNCVFSNSNYGFTTTSSYLYDGQQHQLRDSICNNTDYCAMLRRTAIHNCVFTNFMYNPIELQDEGNNVTNCTIVGDYTGSNNGSMYDGVKCIYINNYGNNITGNTIRNCYSGIYVNSQNQQITYNNFENNKLAIEFDICCSGVNIAVNYNNFINNDVNMQSSYDVDGCNYNYYGSANENEIGATMNDICVGYGSGLITWWPYYVSAVSYTTSLPASNNIINPTCEGPDNHPGFNPRLQVLYFGDATLTSGTYYVTNNVKIKSGATLYIQNQVELIFLSDYNIVVDGAIDVDYCDGGSLDNQGNIRGLIFPNNKITIKGNTAGQQNGCIRIDNGYGRFCNTFFQDLRCGVRSQNNADGTVVDNCAFDNVYAPVELRSYNGGNRITDSDFIDCGSKCIQADGGTQIFNNIIRHFTEYGIYLENNYNYGSIDVAFTDVVFEVSGSINGSEDGYPPVGINLYTYGNGANITHCLFENLYQGIYLSERGNISWNDFKNCARGIYVSSGYANSINYNNFDNCSFNIEVQTSNNINAKYNWNGEVNDIYSVAFIADKMADRCSNDCCFGDGRAIFEPYFDSAIDTTNEDYSIAELLSFQFTNCGDLSSQTSSSATFAPSTSPTPKPPSCPTTIGTIYCDEIKTGDMPDGEEDCWIFEKNDNLQATFSTCGSDIPTSLRVYDLNNNLISDTYCPNQDPMYDGYECNSDRCRPFSTYSRQSFTIPGLSSGTYYVKVGSTCCKNDESEGYQLGIVCGQTPAPTLPPLTDDLTVCDSSVDGFVSGYINNLYFDVGTVGYGETVGFNACPSGETDGFNMFEFTLRLYRTAFFTEGYTEYEDSWNSRGRCGRETVYGTYLEYTNWGNYNGSYILKIDVYNKRGGSYEITKECNVSSTTSFPTSAPTDMVITDTFTCGQIKTGTIGSGDRIYYKIPSVGGIDFSSSCNMTFAFDACPHDSPYVNQIDELAVYVFEIYNISYSNGSTSEPNDVNEGGDSNDINKRGLYNYGYVRDGTQYCDITKNSYEPNGFYWQFTDTQCGGIGPANLYLELRTYTEWNFGSIFDYSIEFKCDTSFIATPTPTLPTGAETMRCGDTKTGIYTDSEIFYKLNNNDLQNEVAFNGCNSNFDTQLIIYELCNGCDWLDWSTERSDTPRFCNDNEDGTYLVYNYGVMGGYSYYLGIQFDDGGYTGECVNCNYDITMECTHIQHTTQYPTEEEVPTPEITPAPTEIDDAIDCSTRDLLGNLKSTSSLRNTYPFYNSHKQFVLFSFCSMANFKSTITLYQEDINNNNKYDVIASAAAPSDYVPGDSCQNITGYFDSGDYWLSIEPKYAWDGEIIGLPNIGQPKYLLNIYCDAQVNTQTQTISTPKSNINCNYVQMSKQKPPMPIGVCNTNYPKDDINERYSYIAQCKSGNNGLEVTMCPNSKICNGNSCFTVDASLESDCSNDATLCDLTVYDYNCGDTSTCQYTTIRTSSITGNQWDDNFDPNTCTKDDTFYETVSMVIDDCYVKKSYGWISGTITCDGINSITMDDYLIPFGNSNPTDFCSTNSAYKYNSSIIYDGGCIWGSYVDITYCPYTAKPTSDTTGPSTKPTKDPTRLGETHKPTPSPTPLPTRSPLPGDQTHQPTPSPSDIITTLTTEQNVYPTSPPTIDIAETASYPYSFVLSITIGFIVCLSLW